MKILLTILFLSTIFNCASFDGKLISTNDAVNNNKTKSCSGKGSISSIGSFSGRLSFNFISQNDSSFCQFNDFLGRKVLLLWLTEDSIDAWNLIENKKYSYSNISEIIPILSVLNPNHLIKFLHGEEIISNQIIVPHQAIIEVKLGKSDKNKNMINAATFIDKSNRQELSIKIHSRVFTQNYFNLKKYWKIIA